MRALTFAYLLAAAINFGLSIFIFFKDRKSKINRSLGSLIFFAALWTLCSLFLLEGRSPEYLLFFRRLSSFSSSLIVAFFLYFSFVFPKETKPLKIIHVVSIFLPGFIFALGSLFTPLLIRDFILESPFAWRPIYGSLYPIATIYYLIYVSFALYNLILKYFRAEDQDKLKMFYVLFGIGSAGVAGILTNLVLPLVGLVQYSYLGPLFTLVMALFIVYAIAAYRLLDIEDFLSRGVIYLALAIGVIGTFAIIEVGKISFLPSFYIALFNFALGTIVFFQNRNSPVNLSFAAVIYIIAIWSYSIGMFLESQNIDQLFLWSKIFYVVGVLIPSVLLYFSIVFPIEKLSFSRFHKPLIFIPSLILIPMVLFTRWMVEEFYILPNGVEAQIGPLYAYYFLYYFAFTGSAFVNLFNKYWKATTGEKVRMRYVLWGMAIVGVVGTIFNVVLPWLGNYRLIWVGPFSTVFLSGLTSYAIVIHRLMSVEVVAQKAFIYTVATGLIMALYAVAVLLSEQFFRGLFRYSSAFLTGLAALIIAVIYQPLVRSFQNFTDRLFFKGRYDYQVTLREISQKIASVIKLEELSRLIVSSFIDTMKVSEISFLLQDRDREHFRSIRLNLPRYKKMEIDIDSPIITWLKKGKDVLVRDEIEDLVVRRPNKILEEVRDEMLRLEIPIWVPIISKDELIGIIALGDKLSGDIFTTEDVGLLGTLANQTAVALDNARLYEEVVNMKDYSEEILQSMVTGVITVDTRGKIVTFNAMAEKITGRQTSEVLGKGSEEIWGNKSSLAKVIENTLANKCYLNYESSILNPVRGLVPVSFSSTVLEDHQKKKIGGLITIQDLTELKELEDKVRRGDKLSALATMAAGMAHEIKNPLSSMKVLSQLLPKKYDDPEFRSRAEEILPREIDRIDRIVSSMLGFARATSLKYEKADINEIIDETLKYFEEQAKQAEIRIEKKYGKLPEIEVDRNQIPQVFSNLILNAIQAMTEGGTLSINTFAGRQVEGVIQEVVIEISDTGHGMSEEAVKKLFDPFYTTKYGGTGLGLTFAHSIVDGHRGDITVKSEIREGTMFTVTLPVSQGLL